MGIRIQREFHSDQGTLYRLNIWDSDYVGAILTTFEINGFELEYERSNNLTCPIQASTCTFKVFGDYLSNFNSFITDLSTAQENEFKVYIEKYESGAYRMYWAGILQSDVISWENDQTREVEFIATDGINRLEDKYFDKITGYSSQVSALKIIFDILSYSGTAQFWSGSVMPYISTSPMWYDTQQSLTRIEMLLSTVYFDKGFLTDYNNSDKTVNRSTTDPPIKAKLLLTQICQLFSLRIKQSDGSWHIQQISRLTTTYTQCNFNYLGNYIGVRQEETLAVVATITTSGTVNIVVTGVGLTGSPINLLANVIVGNGATQVTTAIKAALNANVNITNFCIVSGLANTVVLTKKLDQANDTTFDITISNGTCVGVTTASSSTTVSGVAGSETKTFTKNHNGTTLAVLSDGSFGYYPPLKFAKASIFPSDILNRNYPINQNINSSLLTFTGSTVNLGSMYGGSNLYLFINIYYDVLTWHAIVAYFTKIKITITLIAGIHRITNVNSAAAWTTVSTDTYIDYLDFNAVIDGKNGIFPIAFDPLPFTSGKESNCTIKLDLELVRSTTGTTYPTSAQLNTFFKRLEIVLTDFSTGTAKTGQITGYELENPLSTDNSVDIDFGSMRIHDGGSLSSANVIEVMPNEWTAVSNALLLKSMQWESNHASDEALVYTMLREAITLQKTSIQKYTGGFRSNIYEAFNSINYDSSIWVFQGGRFDAYMDCWDGEWFRVTWNNTGTPVLTTLNNDMPFNKLFRKSIYSDWPTSSKNNLPHKGKTSDKNSSAIAITTINTDGLPTDLLRAGDIVGLINPNQETSIGELMLTADAYYGDTSIFFSSFTPSEDIWPTVGLFLNPNDVIGSKKIRSIESFTLGKPSNQGFERLLYHQTVGLITEELTTDGGIPLGVVNRIAIRDNSIMGAEITIVGKAVGTADIVHIQRKVTFVRSAGVTTISGVESVIGTDEISIPLVAVVVAITANDAQDAIKIDVTGVGGSTINWNALVKCTTTKD